MIRAILGAVVGYVTWSVLWLVGNVAIAAGFPDAFKNFSEGGSLTASGPLAASLTLSIACSLSAGWIVTVIARQRSKGAAWAMASLLLLTGLGVQISAWSRMPIWYHVAFLVLLVPLSLIFAYRRQTTPATQPTT